MGSKGSAAGGRKSDQREWQRSTGNESASTDEDTAGYRNRIDWQAIKTEYITTQTSYRKLAQKYGVHYKVISDRGKNEKWVELRSQHRDKTLTKTLDKISQLEANRAAKVYSVADKLLLKIEALADRPGMMPKDTRSLVAAVKDLKDILGVKSELDKKEQEARIDALRQKSMTGDGDDDDTGVILLPPRIGEAVDDG